MGRNVEIKARLSQAEFDRVMNLAGEITTEPHQVLFQCDTFFNTAVDRLKLREFSDGSAELIAYTRNDQHRPKASGYTRTLIPEPKGFLEAMRNSVGIRGVVEKQRDLFMVGATRIHLDQVQGLGTFLELEVVLKIGQSVEQGVVIAEGLMLQLGIEPDWLISHAYIDLLESDGS